MPLRPRRAALLIGIFLGTGFSLCSAEAPVAEEAVPNRPPLLSSPFITLDIGAVRARGWLAGQLRRQADGLTGNAETVLPDLGSDSGWLGGKGESWEKGAYYVKGLVALAYVLDDAELKARAQKWVDWTLDHQRPDGQIGPLSNADWWPRMVMTWALRDYYEATRDARVLPVLTNYAHYVRSVLPQTPLKEWAKARAGDQIDTFFWLYNRTGDPSLLDVANLLGSQANGWNHFYRTLQKGPGDFLIDHGVNVSQGMKFPLVTYERSGDAKDAAVFAEGSQRLRVRHGLSIGLWSGTEGLASQSTTQGVEMCTVVEQMLSSETAMKVLGDPAIGDQLERITYNLLPGGTTRDFKQYQYYTLPNVPVAHRGKAGYAQDYDNDLLPGPTSGFRCCCYNLHMGWPKYVQHTWMATGDGGLAAVAYGPTEVTVRLGGTPVTITEETDYPFADSLRFVVKPEHPAAFPVKLRVPGWSVHPQVAVNGQPVAGVTAGTFLTLDRTWQPGDIITAEFPANLETVNGFNGSASLWRGPLVFSLHIVEKATPTDQVAGGFNEFLMDPVSPWNYALDLDRANPAATAQLTRGAMPPNPWLPDTTPIKLTVPARRLPDWGLTRHDLLAAEVPPSPATSTEPIENVTLVPFGAQTLRITAFPLLRGAAVPQPGITSSFHNPGDATDAIVDNEAPASSHDGRLPRFTFWDHLGTAEWMQWSFSQPEQVSSVSVYWFDDTGSGRCRVPKSWQLQYRHGDQWLPVRDASGYGTGKDRPNVVNFTPVNTDALRLAVQLQEGVSGGVLQWTKK